MAGVVEGLRWAVLGGSPVPLGLLLASGSVTALLIVTGLVYFGRVERTFADIV